jgi:hypothetical protein
MHADARRGGRADLGRGFAERGMQPVPLGFNPPREGQRAARRDHASALRRSEFRVGEVAESEAANQNIEGRVVERQGFDLGSDATVIVAASACADRSPEAAALIGALCRSGSTAGSGPGTDGRLIAVARPSIPLASRCHARGKTGHGARAIRPAVPAQAPG